MLCKNFPNNKCKFGKNCQFAHDNDELRKPFSKMSD